MFDVRTDSSESLILLPARFESRWRNPRKILTNVVLFCIGSPADERTLRRDCVSSARRFGCIAPVTRISLARDGDDAAGNFYRRGVCVRDLDAGNRREPGPG